MNLPEKVKGYYWALFNYLRTPKGRHDFIDYSKAAVIIAGVMLLAAIAIKLGVSR